MTYLLDSDILIFLARGLKAAQRPGKENEKKAEVAQSIKSQCLRALQKGDTIGISVISICELEFGALRCKDPETERRNLHRFFAPFQQFQLPVNGLSRYYAKVRHQLESTGEMIGQLDMLIAAHALDLKATLVTNNESHFVRISGIQIENWSNTA